MEFEPQIPSNPALAACQAHLPILQAFRSQLYAAIASAPAVPLLASFSSGEGKVVFSTFRVAKNSSCDIMQVLQYMMYNL